MAGDDLWRLRDSENAGVLQGAVGPQGPAGPIGPVGPQGLLGPVGPQGLLGPRGPIGLTGVAGPQGVQGVVGPKGDQGIQGVQGPLGPQGIQGPQGAGVAIKGTRASPADLPATGNTAGDTYIMTGSGSGYVAGDGYSWTGSAFQNVGQIRGPAGPQGAAGAAGAAGPQGAKGDAGAQGVQGPAGVQGPQGIKGDTGLTGVKGDTGTTGATGITGPQGPQGNQGYAGPQGNAGAQGPAGANGADATSPPGGVLHFAMNAAPSGWLKANGAAVSRTSYAALFAAIGTLYGAGDGSTTFNLPDLRGYFLRSLDDGRGVDANRNIGSLQGSQNLSHGHGATGSFLTVGGSSYYFPFDSSYGYMTSNAGTPGVSANGGNEARPSNIALLACIKY